MEPLSTVIVAERVAEAAVVKEIAAPSIELAEVAIDESMITRLNEILDQQEYKKLGEFRELSQTNPEAIPAAFNDINVKGQAGEAIMEANLSQYGQVEKQIPVRLEGADTGNIIDLRLAESNSNVRITELIAEDGQIVANHNYDILKGDSASFEVKNGGVQYLRQEVINGELLQQIKAGKEISDHSFVIINEDTARQLMSSPELAEDTIRRIEEAGGKLVVGLPEQAVQMAVFMS
ncbi:hypothetical protein DOE78_11590 [Bacillus sp. Y1]|nr:hypothetical protein [Bacillus sp. Y1]AYA76028.1 hypothetical protein DOE78_11590 [Bacillus sp. Y1]